MVGGGVVQTGRIYRPVVTNESKRNTQGIVCTHKYKRGQDVLKERKRKISRQPSRRLQCEIAMDDTFAGHDIKPETDILSLSLCCITVELYIFIYISVRLLVRWGFATNRQKELMVGDRNHTRFAIQQKWFLFFILLCSVIVKFAYDNTLTSVRHPSHVLPMGLSALLFSFVCITLRLCWVPSVPRVWLYSIICIQSCWRPATGRIPVVTIWQHA